MIAKGAMRSRAWSLATAASIAACAASGHMKAMSPEASGMDPGAIPAPPSQDVPALIADRVPTAGDRPPVDATELNSRTSGEWAVVREFAPATYDPADTGPRRDFRETIFWSPDVKTGPDGRATVT